MVPYPWDQVHDPRACGSEEASHEREAGPAREFHRENREGETVAYQDAWEEGGRPEGGHQTWQPSPQQRCLGHACQGSQEGEHQAVQMEEGEGGAREEQKAQRQELSVCKCV